MLLKLYGNFFFIKKTELNLDKDGKDVGPQLNKVQITLISLKNLAK